MSSDTEMSPTPEADSDVQIDGLLAEEYTLGEQNISKKALVKRLTEMIEPEHSGETKVVVLAGGAASGKSTLTQSLLEHLANKDIPADTISSDDYNLGDRISRQLKFEGDNPAHPLEKWNLAFMNSQIAAIRKSKATGSITRVPTYDQTTGVAVDLGQENYTHQISPVSVLIVEGDMVQVDNPDASFYLHLNDHQRLHNRLVRDVKNRGGDNERTKASFWHRHHSQHLPYTLPLARNSDIIIIINATEDNWRYSLYYKNKNAQG